jgi:hypothetical protein
MFFAILNWGIFSLHGYRLKEGVGMNTKKWRDTVRFDPVGVFNDIGVTMGSVLYIDQTHCEVDYQEKEKGFKGRLCETKYCLCS